MNGSVRKQENIREKEHGKYFFPELETRVYKNSTVGPSFYIKGPENNHCLKNTDLWMASDLLKMSVHIMSLESNDEVF